MNDEDWIVLAPTAFETLCRDLLIQLGFGAVTWFGGPGDKGRDLTCNRRIPLGLDNQLDLRFVVQCKHTPKGISRSTILDDLAKAAEHPCDVWWLMTTATMTAADRDWARGLDQRDRRKYGFSIEFMDRRNLESWLAQYPDVLARFFPHRSDAVKAQHARAMAFMTGGRYGEAIALLKDSDDGAHPRFSYLLACCYSRLAGADMDQRPSHLAEALAYLTQSKSRGYVEYLVRDRQWPRSCAEFDVCQDIDLEVLRTERPREFGAVFPRPAEGGANGCFPAGVLVTRAEGDLVPIERVMVGDRVRTIDQEGFPPNGSGIVRRVGTSSAETIITNNHEFVTTETQPVLTLHGWRNAGMVKSGDAIVTENSVIVVREIARQHSLVNVYHLSVAGQPVYFANSYCVHNKGE